MNNKNKSGNILAIDPGNQESGAVLIRAEDFKPLIIRKAPNEYLLDEITENAGMIDEAVIEMVASYGMTVGASVFETCVWIGRFMQRMKDLGKKVERLPRMAVKMNMCHNAGAGDSNITQALVDRFAPNTRNKGKGVKAEPGWFYGFKKDIWQAYALGVTYLDEKNF